MGMTKELWSYICQEPWAWKSFPSGPPNSQTNNSPGSTAPQKPEGRFSSLESDVLLEVLYKNLSSKSSITNTTVEANQFFYWQELVFFGEMVLLTK